MEGVRAESVDSQTVTPLGAAARILSVESQAIQETGLICGRPLGKTLRANRTIGGEHAPPSSRASYENALQGAV